MAKSDNSPAPSEANAKTQAQQQQEDEAKALEKSRENSWQEKMDRGEPLNNLEETKADADFNYHQREQERKAREEFEAKKRGRLSPSQEREQNS